MVCQDDVPVVCFERGFYSGWSIHTFQGDVIACVRQMTLEQGGIFWRVLEVQYSKGLLHCHLLPGRSGRIPGVGLLLETATFGIPGNHGTRFVHSERPAVEV